MSTCPISDCTCILGFLAFANANWVSSGGAGAMASMMALDPAQRRVLFIDYHFCDALTSIACLLKGQRPEFWKPLYKWSSYLLSHSFFRRVRKELFSTPWILVSREYWSTIFLHFLLRWKKTLTSRGCRAWLVVGGIYIMILLSITLLMVLYVKWDSWPSSKWITGFFNPATWEKTFSLNQFL